jgi:sensor histidine kinase regulating citrate/malate metabolism
MFAILILNQWMVAFGTVIGNILDNAIEAMLEKPDDRLDGLSLKNGKGFLMNIFK